MADYEIRLYDKGLNLIAHLYPLEGAVQPLCFCWNRRWFSPGQFELRIPLNNPYRDELTTLGNFIEIWRDGYSEALYLIEFVEIVTGCVTQTKDISGHYNAIYAAGQGNGTLRNVIVRTSVDSLSAVGRVEQLLDATDVEEGNLDLLRQRVDTLLDGIKLNGAVVAKTGEQPASDEIITVSGSSPLTFCDRRLIIPPPATVTGDVVNITGSEYDSVTDTADKVMKHFLDNHIINPADASRRVPHFIYVARAPLPVISFDGRFQTVMAALQEIAKSVNVGFEVHMDEVPTDFNFVVLDQRDRTADSAAPVIFYNDDVLLDIPGRAYRGEWDLGDLVTVEVRSLNNLQMDFAIRCVQFEQCPEKPEKILLGLDTPFVSIMEEIPPNDGGGGDPGGGDQSPWWPPRPPHGPPVRR